MQCSCGGETVQRVGYIKCRACGRVLRDTPTNNSDHQFVARAVLDRLSKGPSAAAAIAATLAIELFVARSVLDGLVTSGGALKIGILYQLPRLAA